MERERESKREKEKERQRQGEKKLGIVETEKKKIEGKSGREMIK